MVQHSLFFFFFEEQIVQYSPEDNMPIVSFIRFV